jgi:hypothetical protein
VHNAFRNISANSLLSPTTTILILPNPLHNRHTTHHKHRIRHRPPILPTNPPKLPQLLQTHTPSPRPHHLPGANSHTFQPTTPSLQAPHRIARAVFPLKALRQPSAGDVEREGPQVGEERGLLEGDEQRRRAGGGGGDGEVDGQVDSEAEEAVVGDGDGRGGGRGADVEGEGRGVEGLCGDVADGVAVGGEGEAEVGEAGAVQADGLAVVEEAREGEWGCGCGGWLEEWAVVWGGWLDWPFFEVVRGWWCRIICRHLSTFLLR